MGSCKNFGSIHDWTSGMESSSGLAYPHLESLGNVIVVLFVEIDNSRLFQNLKISCESSFAGNGIVQVRLKSAGRLD